MGGYGWVERLGSRASGGKGREGTVYLAVRTRRTAHCPLRSSGSGSGAHRPGKPPRYPSVEWPIGPTAQGPRRAPALVRDLPRARRYLSPGGPSQPKSSHHVALLHGMHGISGTLTLMRPDALLRLVCPGVVSSLSRTDLRRTRVLRHQPFVSCPRSLIGFRVRHRRTVLGSSRRGRQCASMQMLARLHSQQFD